MRSAAEVGGWNKAHRMGIALAVVCHLEEGRFETFLEPRAAELAATLKAAGLVVGFNSRRFDYAVLSGYTGEDYARTLPTLDLLDSDGRASRAAGEPRSPDEGDAGSRQDRRRPAESRSG